MKVAISVIGKFHSFDLARQMHARGSLAGIFSGYPRFKLRAEGLPQALIHTFPWVHAPYMALRNRSRLGRQIVRSWEHLDHTSLDAWVARSLPPCDVFVGLSGSALRSGIAAKRNGARYVCDRGSSHIRVQDELLREEHDRWGLHFPGIDPRAIEREEAEYQLADLITVPSTFAYRSFVSQGVPDQKLRRLPYGVDLARFRPVGKPAEDRFDVLFVGSMTLQKGIPYLLKAFRALVHPRKSLTFAGVPSQQLLDHLRRIGIWVDEARVLGHVTQASLSRLMSQSHVLVLPSIQEGLALVQAQAMACRCPVVGTSHTGAEDLFEDGRGGYIVPIRNADAIAARLQGLADEPSLREEMGRLAQQRVQDIGGWEEYGGRAMHAYDELR